MSTEPQISAYASQSDSLDSKIAVAQGRVHRFGESANNWNKWYVRGLLCSLFVGGLSLIVAATTVAFQWFAIRDSRLVSDSQSELLHLKDLKAAEDSRNKDLEIGKANERAAKADERAGQANERAGEANKEAGKANERAAQLELTAADLKKQNLQTESRLEQEKQKRLELQQFIQWREIDVVVVGQEKNIDFIAPYAGTTVYIQHPPDAEPSNAAAQLAFVLNAAGWKVIDTGTALGGAAPAGVTITTLFVSPQVSRDGWEASQKRVAIAEKLAEFLEANDWDAEVNWLRDKEMLPARPGTDMLITIGSKQNTYFMTDGFKQLRNKRREATKQLREHFQDLKKRAMGQ